MVIFIEKKPIANIIDVNFDGSKFDEIQQEISRTLLKTNTGINYQRPRPLEVSRGT